MITQKKMTKNIVNSKPKASRGSKKGNKFVTSFEDSKQSNKLDIVLVDKNNVHEEIEKQNKFNNDEELILTPNSLFKTDIKNTRKCSPEDLKDVNVQKTIASNGCIVFIQSKEKDYTDSIVLFCPKTYETNSISQFKSFFPVLLSYPGCAKKDNSQYVSEHVKSMVSFIPEVDPLFYTGKTYLLCSKMIQDIFVPEHLRNQKNKLTLALEEILFKCNLILPELVWVNVFSEKKNIVTVENKIMEFFRHKASYNNNASYAWNDSYCPFGEYTGKRNNETHGKNLINGAIEGEVMEWVNELLKNNIETI